MQNKLWQKRSPAEWKGSAELPSPVASVELHGLLLQPAQPASCLPDLRVFQAEPAETVLHRSASSDQQQGTIKQAKTEVAGT